MTDQDAQIYLLQQQQALFTNALQAMLQGRWTGEGSVEAYLYALNPNVEGELVEFDTPVTHSQLDETEPPKAG